MVGRQTIQTHDGRAKRRRDGRGFGPFTSGHLTIIIVTLLIVVAFPFAAFAVTGNNVFVTDATSGARAKVDSGGHLLVGDGSSALTVDGTVNDRAALPTKPIVITPQTATNVEPFAKLYGPVNKPFAIGSLTLTNQCSAVEVFQLFSTTSPGARAEISEENVASLATLHLDFPIPLVTTPPSGGTVTLSAFSAGSCVKVSAVGSQS